MPYLQELIHKLEVGPWFRYIKFSLPCLALVLLVVGYNWRSFRNMGTQEAMDAAQVARNVSEGKGYTTLNIRPLSIYLVKTRREAKLGVAAACRCRARSVPPAHGVTAVKRRPQSARTAASRRS